MLCFEIVAIQVGTRVASPTLHLLKNITWFRVRIPLFIIYLVIYIITLLFTLSLFWGRPMYCFMVILQVVPLGSISKEGNRSKRPIGQSSRHNYFAWKVLFFKAARKVNKYLGYVCQIIFLSWPFRKRLTLPFFETWSTECISGSKF